MRRASWVLGAFVLLAPTAGGAQVNCPTGQSVTMDTYGHCCFGGQVWAESKQACVGVPTCPTGMSVQGETCVADQTPVVECPLGKTVSQDTQGHCCWSGQAWSTSRGACAGVPQCPQGLVGQVEDCVVVPPPVTLTPQPTYVAPTYGAPTFVAQPISTPTPSYDMRPPALDTTRKWLFTDVAAYDASMQGLGDIFTVDVPIARLGNTNSSLSIGAGVGFIFSLAHDANFAIPIPITLTGRFGFGTSIELDARIGGVPYYYSVNSKTDYWGGKFDVGMSLRIPISDTGGFGLLAGVDLYVINGIVALPEIGFTL